MSAVIAIAIPEAIDEYMHLMWQTLSHRTPQGAHSHQDFTRGVGIGQGHSAVTDEAAYLPALQDGVVIAADVRLDNRADLLQALAADTAALDADLLRLAYLRWGADCGLHLKGDFAFVLWDERRSRWFAAVDRMGTRPLYYTRIPLDIGGEYSSTLAFASEIKALMALPGVRKRARLNDAFLADWLTFRYLDSSSTVYADIFALPPAHTLILDVEATQRKDAASGQLRIQRYWHYDLNAQLDLRDDRAYADAFRQVFLQAVQERARTPYPIGANLSGGLDSSSIVAMLQHLHDELPAIHSFSGRFSDAYAQEGAYMDAVIAQGHITAHSVAPESINPLIEYDALLAHADEPLLYANYHIQYAAAQIAQSLGIRIWFDGLYGDSAVSHGEAQRAAWAYHNNIPALYRSLRRTRQRLQSMSASPQRLTWDYWKRYSPLAKTLIRIKQQVRPAQPGDPARREAHINAAFAQRVSLSDRLRAAYTSDKPEDTGRAAHYADLAKPLYDRLIRLDVAFKWFFGFQGVYPYRDADLLQLCLSLPARYKLRDGYGRYIVRIALAHDLPDVVRWRAKKANMGPALRTGLLQHEAGRIEALLAAPERIAAYMDVDNLRQNYAQMQRLQQRQEKPRDNSAMPLLQALGLDAWLRSHDST